jgi:hypothetical protein
MFCLQRFSQLSVTEGDLYLTNYNLDKLKAMNLSPCRWAESTDIVLMPGFGSGTLRLGEHEFKITYAWLGGTAEDSKDKFKARSYTVRVSGTNVKESFNQLMKQIIADENDGKLYWDMPIKQYMKEKLCCKNMRQYRKDAYESRERLIKLLEAKDSTLSPKFRSVMKRLVHTDEQLEQDILEFQQELKAGGTRKIYYKMNNLDRIGS